MDTLQIFTPHNHNHCIEKALTQAEAICSERKVRLTSIRRRVLSLIWQSHKPLGAYHILNTLTTENKRAVAPPTVYRALDFLLENQLIHRLTSCNAFIGCLHPTHSHQGYFLICSQCKVAIELNHPPINKVIQQIANEINFKIEQQMVEVLGTCSYCQVNHEKPTD